MTRAILVDIHGSRFAFDTIERKFLLHISTTTNEKITFIRRSNALRQNDTRFRLLKQIIALFLLDFKFYFENVDVHTEYGVRICHPLVSLQCHGPIRRHHFASTANVGCLHRWLAQSNRTSIYSLQQSIVDKDVPISSQWIHSHRHKQNEKYLVYVQSIKFHGAENVSRNNERRETEARSPTILPLQQCGANMIRRENHRNAKCEMLWFFFFLILSFCRESGHIENGSLVNSALRLLGAVFKRGKYAQFCTKCASLLSAVQYGEHCV